MAEIHKTKTAPVGNVYYGNTAVTYQQRREGTKRWARENAAVESLLKGMPDGISVLDIPFGTGRFVPFYLAKRMKITGIDISKEMLAAAQSGLGASISAGTLEVGDALNIHYPANSFDLVVCVRFLQNIISFGSAQTALREMSRVTRANAILEVEIRKDDAPGPGPPKEDQPMRGLLYRADIDNLLRSSNLAISKLIGVYDHGPSDYSILLCRKI